MKKRPLGSFWGLALLSALPLGCAKENVRTGAHAASAHRYMPKATMSASVGLFEVNTMPWNQIVAGYDDVDTRRRHAKTFLALGLAEVVKDPVIAAWILAEGAKHEDDVFYFEALFAHFPDTKTIIESTIDPLRTYTGWTFEAVQNEMQYDAYNIKASIYVALFDGLNTSLKPMVTTGEDIGTDAASGSDKVFALYVDKANNVTKVSIWPEVSLMAKAPIFAIDGRATNIHDLYDKPGPVTPMTPLGDPPVIDPAAPPDDANMRIAITKVQVGYRYDNTGSTEVELSGKIAWTPTYNSGNGSILRNFLRPGGCYSSVPQGNNSSHYRLLDISASDVSNWIVNPTDKFFCWMHQESNWADGEYDHNYVVDPSSPHGYSWQPRKVIFFNTYEVDAFYTSNKELTPEWVNDVHVDLKGKMNNYNEWYQFDPAAGQNVWWNLYAMRLHMSMNNYSDSTGWHKDLWTNPVKGMLGFKTTSYCTY